MRNIFAILTTIFLFHTSLFADTFNVTRMDDPVPNGCSDSDCSLREAVIAANANAGTDSIAIPSGRYILDIAGTGEDLAATGDLDLTDSVSITGASQRLTVIDGNEIDRVFHILSNAVVANFEDLTIENGNASAADNGGGIFNDGGTLNLTSVSLLHNFADDGGALQSQSGATTTIEDCNISSNRANTNGGGVYNFESTLTVVNSTISENQIVDSCCNGGGIDSEGAGASASISGSTIQRNFAGANGGGIYAFSSSSVRLQVTNSNISFNQADSNGGGIYTSASMSDISDSIVQGNFAGNSGGGLYHSANPFSIAQSSFLGNIANGSGGGIRCSSASGSITNSTIAGNLTLNFGGGIHSGTDQLDIQNTTISSNMAYEDGAALRNSGVNAIVITNSTVADNIADVDVNASGTAGGIDNSLGGTVTLKNTILARNIEGGTTVSNCGAGTTVTSNGNNLDSDSTCGLGGSGDISGKDARIGALADNGGDTLTHLPLVGSPVIDKGDNGSCSATDQRGFARPVDSDENGTATCEIGSVEIVTDCNENNVPDETDILDGTSEDCSSNGIPDECEADSDSDGTPDSCDVCDGLSDEDSNGNGVIDCLFELEFHALLGAATDRLEALKKKSSSDDKSDLKDLVAEIREFVSANKSELPVVAAGTDLESLATKTERKVGKATRGGKKFKRSKRRALKCLRKLDQAVTG